MGEKIKYGMPGLYSDKLCNSVTSSEEHLGHCLKKCTSYESSQSGKTFFLSCFQRYAVHLCVSDIDSASILIYLY